MGLTPARLRGISDSRCPYLLFLDDDNLLDRDYLRLFLVLATLHPRLGCIGAGRIVPEYEVEPAAELDPYLCSLALRDESLPRWSNDPADGIRPWGAGLGISRDVADAYASGMDGNHLKQSLDRRGASLVSGGDDEFSWQACAQGMGKGYFPELKLTHLIPARRVEKSYLLQLAKGQAFSDLVLGYIHGHTVCVPPVPSTFGDIFFSLCRFRVSSALAAARSFWDWRYKPQIEREFEEVRRAGFREAREMLARQFESEALAGMTPSPVVEVAV